MPEVMTVVDLLPSPLYVQECPFHDKVKSLFLAEIEQQDGEIIKNPRSHSLTHIDHYSVVQDDRFSRFRTWVENCAEDFMSNVMGYYLPETMQVTDSWINICNEGGYQSPHFHSNSVISALYYVNFDPEKHSHTYFGRPRLGMSYPQYNALQIPYHKETRYNQFDCVTGAEGRLFLWESHMIHGFKVNNHPNRITVAMNLMPTVISNGDYGWRVQLLEQNEREEHVSAWRQGQLWDLPNLLPKDQEDGTVGE